MSESYYECTCIREGRHQGAPKRSEPRDPERDAQCNEQPPEKHVCTPHVPRQLPSCHCVALQVSYGGSRLLTAGVCKQATSHAAEQGRLEWQASCKKSSRGGVRTVQAHGDPRHGAQRQRPSEKRGGCARQSKQRVRLRRRCHVSLLFFSSQVSGRTRWRSQSSAALGRKLA